MDVSPETIRTVEFRERLRGYNQDDVDQFLERMAAGVEILQQRLVDANERAARAEQQAQRAHQSEDDDALRRTLTLAQRTADLAVEEAREQAARIVESAQGHAQTLMADAEEQARRASEEAQARLRQEVARLQSARERLRQEVASLEHLLAEARGRAQAALTQAARQLEEAMPATPVPSLRQEPEREGESFTEDVDEPVPIADATGSSELPTVSERTQTPPPSVLPDPGLSGPPESSEPSEFSEPRRSAPFEDAFLQP